MAKASKSKKTVKATTKPVMTKPNKIMKDMMKTGMPGKMMN